LGPKNHLEGLVVRFGMPWATDRPPRDSGRTIGRAGNSLGKASFVSGATERAAREKNLLNRKNSGRGEAEKLGPKKAAGEHLIAKTF